MIQKAKKGSNIQWSLVAVRRLPKWLNVLVAHITDDHCSLGSKYIRPKVGKYVH